MDKYTVKDVDIDNLREVLEDIDIEDTEVDYYKQLASKRYNIPIDEVTSQQRSELKREHFMDAYGLGGGNVNFNVKDDDVDRLD